MSSLRRQLAAVYFSFDTRSLAAFRIALGLALFVDLWSRHRVLDGFYTSHRGEALALLLAAALVFGALLVGLFTKLAQLLALIAVVGMNLHLAPLASGVDVVLRAVCLWSLFLPLGERFSIDAVRASLRRREQQSPHELNDRAPIRTPARRAYSLACLALLLQFAVLYLLGHTWEMLAAALILNPFGRRYTSLLALAVLPSLHVVFDVGMFSLATIAFYPLLLEPSHWEWLSDKLARWHKRRVVYVDEDCGFCMQCARLLARLDVLERLEFGSNADLDRLPPGVTLEMANESITTLEIDSGHVRRGAAAFAALFRSLLGGFVPAIPLELPGLRGLAERAYALVANNRLQISLWLGYAACGLPLTAAESADAATEPSAAAQWFARAGVIAREACVLSCLVVVSLRVAGCGL